MNKAEIRIEGEKPRFKPGDLLKGYSTWTPELQVENAEIRLFWFTEGLGTQDIGIADVVKLPEPITSNHFPFEFSLPDHPYSMDGNLFSISWALELVMNNEKIVERFDFIMAPGGTAIELPEPVPGSGGYIRVR